MHQIRASAILSSLLDRIGIMIVLASLLLGMLLPATAFAQKGSYDGRGAREYGNYGGYQSCTHHHTVMIGETLLHIAAEYGVDPHELAQINGVNNPNHIFEHQRLCIPEPYADPGYYGEAKEHNMAYSGRDQYNSRQDHSPVDHYGDSYWMGIEMAYPGRDPVDNQGYGPAGDRGGYGTGHDADHPRPDHEDEDDDNGSRRDRDIFEDFTPALLITSAGPATATARPEALPA